MSTAELAMCAALDFEGQCPLTFRVAFWGQAPLSQAAHALGVDVVPVRDAPRLHIGILNARSWLCRNF